MFSYYHFISGVDFFCSTNSQFDAFFENNVNGYIAKVPNSEDYLWRIQIWSLENYLNRRTKFGDFICHYANKIQRKICQYISLRRSLPLNLTFSKGSNWFSLHEDFVQYIFVFLKENHWYKKRYANTVCSDESFFHTILYNSPLAGRIVNDNLRYVDWKATYPNENLPRILNEKDFEKIKNSGCFFCRKMDLQKSQRLLELLNAID